jgi:hypothetical protein
MKDTYLEKEISVKVNIYVADDFLAEDVALIELRTGFGDENKSKFSEEEFKTEIREGNLVVAMIREDPIAYAIVHDGKVVEHYVEWMFKDSKLEEILLAEAITL